MSDPSPTLLPPAGARAELGSHLRSPTARYVAGVLALAAAYYGAAKLGQTLRYTASVSAIWPPAGLGIAALYLWGLRWWPGIFIGELIVNGELLLDDTALPLGSLVGQQAGNMAEIIVGAMLLRAADRRRARPGSGRAGRRHARGARDRHGDQRDGGHGVDAGGRGHRARPRRRRSGARGGSATPRAGSSSCR